MLSPAEIDHHCRRLLEPVRKYVHSKLGPEGADHAGACLYTALTKYDASRGGLDGYVLAKTLNLVKDALRQFDGREGTARHTARRQRCAIEDWDGGAEDPDVGREQEVREEMAQALGLVERATGLRRWLLIGRTLCGLPDRELAKVLDVSEEQIRCEGAALREPVSAN